MYMFKTILSQQSKHIISQSKRFYLDFSGESSCLCCPPRYVRPCALMRLINIRLIFHTWPSTTLLKMVFLSFSFTSRSINVSLFVLTWNVSFVHSAPENLQRDPNENVKNWNRTFNLVKEPCHFTIRRRDSWQIFGRPTDFF